MGFGRVQGIPGDWVREVDGIQVVRVLGSGVAVSIAMRTLGAEESAALGFQVHKGKSFPAVAVSEFGVEEAEEWAKTEGEEFLAEKLKEHGALLFRGVKLQNPEDFNRFLKGFEAQHFSMEAPLGGGGPRLNVVGPVHTSTESPKEFRIPFHHELAYITEPPSKLFFYCEIAPTVDGETPILLSELVVDRLMKEKPEFVEKLKRLGVKYVRTLDAETGKYQRGWKDAFQASTPEEAEKNATLCGTEKSEFLSGDRMRVTTKKFDAIREEHRTGVPTWFNAVCLLHPAAHGKESGDDGANDAGNLWDVTYGDDSPIDGEDVIYAKRVMDECGTQFKWQAGDVLVVDNWLALHSRNSFEPPRRILVAMC